MVEANGRKCTFMSQVARKTGANAVVHNERIEKMDVFDVDIVTSRACARVQQLLLWAEPFIKQKTEIWFLKGEGVEDELTEASQMWNMETEYFTSLSSPSGKVIRLTNVVKR